MKPLIKLAALLAITGMAGFTPGVALAQSSACHCQGNTSAMMQQHHRMAMGAPGEGEGMEAMKGQGMGGPQAEQNEHRNGAEWMHNRQEHLQKVVAKLKEMESDLDHKVAEMNQATGQEKLSDMSAVLNELVHQRDEIINHVGQMQEHHLAWMQQHQERFGQNAVGGTGENAESSHGSGSSFQHHSSRKEPSQK